MEWHKIGGWASDHPYATGGIVLGIGLLLLWYLGYFSSGSSSSSGNGQSSLASAYYAAEAQQSIVAGQIQQATVAEAGASTRAGIAAQAATAIAASHDQRDVLLGQQGVGIAQINNDAATAQVVSNNNTALQTALNHDLAGEFNNIVTTIFPSELTAGSGDFRIEGLPGATGAFSIGAGPAAIYQGPINPAITSPNVARTLGYSEASIAKLFP